VSIQIYDTLTKTKSEFRPINKDEVKMYVCGPTVYNLLHVGNFMGPVFYNLLRNWLEHRGFKVNYIFNYTDVDDKIIKKSLEENIPASEISEKYINEFQKDYASLKLKPHSHNPKVTDSMDEIISFIAELVSKNKAYELQGDVYFSVKDFEDYGKLSNKNVDELLSGSRIELNENKKHPTDFALWKKAKDGEPSWDSPWSKGRPGWHIECSVMSHKFLGPEIDIHGGGIDLVFPHHENEIAQSEACNGGQYVKYWVHNNLLEMGAEKMSKSKGNIVSLRDYVEEFNGEIYKYLVLSSHYRSILSFTPEQTQRSISQLAKFYSALALSENIISAEGEPGDLPKKFKPLVDQTKQKIDQALDDDFNTPEAFAALFVLLKAFNQRCAIPGPITPDKKAIARAFKEVFISFGKLMSLFQEPAVEFLTILDDMLLKKLELNREEIDSLVLKRKTARDNKDFDLSDKIRGQLTEMGILVQDRSGGEVIWEVAK
jgi:cysteinyl-tRNA synthetase